MSTAINTLKNRIQSLTRLRDAKLAEAREMLESAQGVQEEVINLNASLIELNDAILILEGKNQ